MGVLNGQAGNAGSLQLFHRAADVQGVAVAMVGVDHQAEVTGAADAVDLLGKLGQGQDDEVRGSQHGAGGY